MQRAQEAEVPFLKILITALSVTDRPDLIDYRRKTSTKAGGGTEPSGSVGSKCTGYTCRFAGNFLCRVNRQIGKAEKAKWLQMTPNDPQHMFSCLSTNFSAIIPPQRAKNTKIAV